MQGNAEHIDLDPFDHLISVATGCSAELMDYPGLLSGTKATEWQDKHCEVTAYLASQQEKLSFRPLQKTVLLHHPCTARNVLRDIGSAMCLLRKIPQLNVVESRHYPCCGAAGVTMFRTPKTAGALAEDIVEEAARCGAEILVTSNVGCALHLRGSFRVAGLDVAVKHPVNLLREQLQD